MIVFSFFVALLVTTLIINNNHGVEATDETLEFDRSESGVILILLVISIILQLILPKFIKGSLYYIIVVFLGSVFAILMYAINLSREKIIKDKHEKIKIIYEALQDIFGKMDEEDIDFNDIPFTFSINEKFKYVDTIVIDTRHDGKFRDDAIIYAQNELNKFFPKATWVNEMDVQNRTLTFRGLPKPPKIAKFPGTDYRPAGWIPLGLNGAGEVGWNLSNPKNKGISSYVNDDGEIVELVDLPSAPQAMTLGSTGGGKSIVLNSKIKIKRK